MATLLASLVLAVAAPLASASVTVVSAGNVPKGGTSSVTASFTFTENSKPCFLPSGSQTALIVQIWDQQLGSTVHFGTPNPPTAPSSMGVSVALATTVAFNDTFKVKFTASDTGAIEQVTIDGLLISADSLAALGPIQAKLTGTEARCVLPPTTATGTLQSNQAPGSSSILVNLTSPCPFSQNVGLGADPNAGNLVFATNGESVNVTSAGQPALGQQALTIASTAFAHPAGETVTQTVSNCSPVIGSPGVVVGGTGRLCIFKFNDGNGDGVQDGNPIEPLLGGFVITIRDLNQNVVGWITTAVGVKTCIDLPPGTYTATEDPQGLTPTTPGGLMQTAHVVAGQMTTLLFGNHDGPLTGRLCITKVNDVNGDGILQTTDPPIANWPFTITGVTGQVFTLKDGKYCVNLPVGSATVTDVVPPGSGWVQTYPTPVGPQTVPITAGHETDLTFGNHRCCLTFTWLAGKIDNFSLANGATAEPANPVVPIPANAQLYFDGTAPTALNKPFSQRFVLGFPGLRTNNCIQSATLEIRVKPLRTKAAITPIIDTIRISSPNSSWNRTFNALSTAAGNGSWVVGHAAELFTWQLDGTNGGPSLINQLNSSRQLDVIVKNNTSVDYIRLTVVFCECAPATT